MEKEIKLDRVMELFFRAMKGESLSVQQLAFEYNVCNVNQLTYITSITQVTI